MAAQNRQLGADVAEKNPKDKLAVAVMKSGTTIGHVPYNLVPMPNFLKRNFNKGTAEIAGDKVNHGGGHSYVQCTYHLYGPRAYIESAEKMLTEDKIKARMRLCSRSDLPKD